MDGQTLDGELVAKSGQLPSLLIPPDAVQIVTLNVVPHCPGVLQITGFAYSLTTAAADESNGVPAPVVRGWHELVVRGPKLRPTKDRPDVECFADDKRLHITVLPAAPHLIVSFFSFDTNRGKWGSALTFKQIKVTKIHF